ncbi:MAG: hypothetical protein HXX08_13865 [Chloroflexi bacterium]|uniref:Uncharacterized protein n=1 Tax=Candidatus Chlorohelix allophototropha TaxID=3003348 RepID=A0A8T7M4D0_9CHLR|nr:hypothetical protein [Chloroflexota bacterium]WJW70060.1 hypothetical protein OZ401_004864 [Chloroflexota bacterium L227-S17]
MQHFKLAVSSSEKVLAYPGHKPDMGTGLEWSKLSEWQKRCRLELNYYMLNAQLTADQIAYGLGKGATITAQHTGAENCQMEFDSSGRKHLPCRYRQHRCNANFLAVQYLGADFDTLSSEAQIWEHPVVRKYASIIYNTVSSTFENPKMRVIFLLDDSIEDGEKYRHLVRAMQWLFENKPDPSCTDYCRLFLGNSAGNPVVTGNILPLSVAEEWGERYSRYLNSKKPPVKVAINYTVSGNQSARVKAFSAAVIRKLCDKVQFAVAFTRHETLKKSLVSVFYFINGGVIDESEAIEALRSAWSSHNRPEDFDPLVIWAKTHITASQGLPED